MDVPLRHLEIPTPVGSLPRVVTLAIACLAAATVSTISGCGEEETSEPPSLDTPTAVTSATRDRCGSASPVLEGFGDGECALGLITNADNDRVAVTDLGRRRPRLVDLDPTVPAFTHIKVGRRPMEIAASPDGTTAYTLNSVDGTLSVVDLWRLEALETSLPLDGSPAGLATAPGEEDGGQIAVVTNDPDAIWLREGVHCNESSDGADCTGLDADPNQFPLPGQPADLETSADGRLAYIVYDNRDFMSVVALPGNDEVLDNDRYACRGGRTGAPCEAGRVGLTYDCSDGVDSDGDGLVDQQDPQCWSPTDAESPAGTGRRYNGACADGIDNDGDGAIDRNDEDCQLGADDSEAEKLNPDATFMCSDGEDNDDDGFADYPDDPDCYGPNGRRESAVETTGFTSISADRAGAFVYVVDGTNSQVLTVDAERAELIDAGRTSPPHGAPFTERLGIAVGARANEAAGFVTRNVTWQDPDDDAHGIVEYTFGAYVASNNGRVYPVRTVTSDCEVRETDRDSLLSNRQFRIDSEAFQNSNERHCLEIPEFPLQPQADDGDDNSCEAARMCRGCLEAEPDGMENGCEQACEDFEENRRRCRVQGRRLSPDENVELAVNPRFAPIDTDQNDGRLRGVGTCSEPSVFIEQMRDYVAETPGAPSAFGCTSSLRDQPIERFASEEELDEPTFEDLERADLLQLTRLRLTPPTDGSEVTEQIVERPYDFRYRDESWRVTWEGVLPGTRREDGLLTEESEQTDEDDQAEAGQLQTDPVDLCEAGVEAGDRVIIRNTPETGSDAPDRCDDLVPEGDRTEDDEVPEDDDPYLTYRVDEVRPGELQMATMDSERFAQTLPTRGCFRTAIRYEIRAEDEWTVVGDQSGFQSRRTSAVGQCVPRFGADSSRTQGRVASDDIYVGPYLEFLLYEGPVSPIRRPDAGYSFTFGVQRFFSSQRFRTGTSLPSDILLTPRVSGGAKLMVSDASDDFVWLQNVTFPNDDPRRLR